MVRHIQTIHRQKVLRWSVNDYQLTVVNYFREKLHAYFSSDINVWAMLMYLQSHISTLKVH